MMNGKKIIIAVILLCFVPLSRAMASSATDAAADSIKKNSAQLQSTQGSDAIRDTDTASGTSQEQSSINQAADRGRRSQNSGMMMNMMASAALFASCFASHPPNMPLCAMGALAAAQAANQGSAANASDMTFDASQFDPGDYNYGMDTDGDGKIDVASGDPGDIGFTDPIISDGLGKLSEAGYRITEDGVYNPDGSFTPASAFDSPAAMMAAGMSPATASAAGDVMDTINKELQKAGANVVAMPVSAGGGGYSSGGGSAADFGDLSSFKLPSLKNPFDNVDKKKLIAGKSLMVGGEPIGVKGDNIFDMVHRAYQKKRGRNQFLETTKGPARLPASMTAGGGNL